MRPIDADAVLDRYYAEYERQDICDGAEDREWLMKCLNEAPTLTPPNEPLTLLSIELTIYAALAEWLILGVILLVGIRRWNKRFGELYDKLLEEWANG